MRTVAIVVLTIGFALSLPSFNLLAQSNVKSAPSIYSSSTQFLVLKTGSVYSGQLEFNAGKYIIHRKNGSSVRFHQGEVDFVTDSLENAYQQLLSRLRKDDVIGHQRLAQWCLKNRQVENARRQLATLQQLPGGTKSLKLLTRQIEELANPRTEQTPAELTAHTQPDESGIRRLPRTGPQLASRDELMETIDSFSRESLREFNRSVHFRIVNGCAAASCHGDTENPFRLWRVDKRGGITSTGVQRNLHAITRYINRENPQESVLLRYVSEVHADMDAPAYEATSHHFHAIRDWVMNAVIEDEENTEDKDASVSQTTFLDRPGNIMQGELIPSPVDLTREEKRFVPRDEFDPQIFNRTYGDSNSRAASATNLQGSREKPPAGKITRSLPPIDDK